MTDRTDPADPADPANPTQPVQPEQPVEAAHATQPDQPPATGAGEPVGTTQPAATPPPPAAAAAAPGESPLEAYVRENHLRFSEPAMRSAALAAGNSPAAVEAALARYRRPDPNRGAGTRAARMLLVAYVAAFVVLGIGMLTNSVTQGGDIIGGIWLALIVWAIVLGVGYGVSMIWIASRRTGLIVIGIVIAFFGLSFLGAGGLAGPISLIVGIGMVVGALAFGGGFGREVGPSIPVLLSVPLLLLVALAGTCIATGIPIPGGLAT